jgi:crotonobetaine/carnitine-CoA ligase
MAASALGRAPHRRSDDPVTTAPTLGSSHVFSGLDVPWLVDAQAARWGNKPFIVWEPFDGEQTILGFAEFAERTRAVAAGLAHRGVCQGDCVLVHLDNCPEFLIAWYACARLGVIAVTTNARSSADELSYFAGHCGAVGAITQPALADVVSKGFPEAVWIALTETDNGAEPAQPVAHDDSFERLVRDPSSFTGRAPDPALPVSVQYTSGTTARPKGVVWTHANALWGAKVNAAHEDLRHDDVHLTYLPLFHCNAQSYSVAASLWAGATVVLQPRFSARRFWPVSLRNGATWTSIVAFAIKALLDHPVPEQHSYRLWGNGTCDNPSDPHFRVRSIGWWGMTETITHGIVGDPLHPNTPMTCGRVASEYEIRIVDSDGRDVEPGGTGDLLIRGVRGVSLFAEYLHDPAATAASFDDGYFMTGDRVTLLEDGSIRFADRSKDMLKVGGENVAASEVERVIAALPGVREVAVVGRAHDMLQEVPVAFVIPLSGTTSVESGFDETILGTCREKLASFKVPAEVRFVDELPRATLGKIAKAELRKLLAGDDGA